MSKFKSSLIERLIYFCFLPGSALNILKRRGGDAVFNIHIGFSFKSSFSQKPAVKQDYLERGQLVKPFLSIVWFFRIDG